MAWPAITLSFILVNLTWNCCSVSTSSERHKRNLVYTRTGNIVQLIMGTGVPIPLEGTQAMTMGWVLKAAYATPNNASVYTNPYVTFQKRSITEQVVSRFELYKSLDEVFRLLGGKGCVLRAICEASQTPFRATSLVGQIMHIIFAPSSTDESPSSPTDTDYISASKMGEDKQINCGSIYPECILSPLDILSVIS